MAPLFTLAHDFQPELLRDTFTRHGRIEIPNFLSMDQAERLRAHLLVRDDWLEVMNAGDKVYEIARTALADMSAIQKQELDARVIDAGRHGFQYRYESIRVPDNAQARNTASDILHQFVEFMSSAPVLNLLAFITGKPPADFADGQATAYSPGHFLTRHDDDVAGKNRQAAYVLGLAPDWRAEWGGLLMFHGSDGNIEEAFCPAMGALRLFTVPAVHSVSYVTPMAPEARLSVTGWLRNGV